ncbi:MAG: stage II sporulation protein M [Demequinaceae bacterium]|nr:stage II sporulation protein M [Demequinaceae bacterium]
MDIDALSAARAKRWARLKDLSKGRALSGAEADELTRLFQQTAGDLSAVQSTAPDPGLVARLSLMLAGARVWMTGAHAPSLSEIRRFVVRELPAALYRVRWWSVGAAGIFILLATVAAVYTFNTPEALDLAGSAESRAAYAQQQFESYYSEYDPASFAAQVWTNNWWIAAQCFLLGWFLGLIPIVVVYTNAVGVGVTAAIMAEHGMLGIFFQLISPHGLLELSAVIVAAAVGFRLFWTMLVPGPRNRGRAFGEEGRAAITIILALVIVLLVSGLIEAFITPSSLPWAVKDVIGIVAVTAFWVYTFVVGRAAVHEGATGDIEGAFASAVLPVSA